MWSIQAKKTGLWVSEGNSLRRKQSSELSILKAHGGALKTSLRSPRGETGDPSAHIPAARGHSSVPPWHAGLEKNPQASETALPSPALYKERPLGSACCVFFCVSAK